MIIETAVVSPFGTNCYVVGCPEVLKCAVIDPGDDADEILAIAERSKMTVEAILLTHGHIDHAGAAGAVRDATGAKISMHRDDAFLLEHGSVMAAQFGWFVPSIPAPDSFLEDGDEVAVGNLKLKVLHTPGHSPGGICFASGKTVFSGDLVFAGSIGRTDLPGGSFEALIRSVREKIFPLPDATKLLCGHGPSTTVGREKKTNPFLREGGGLVF
jgi:glyoxylase-like metal-dependent hydrolase (beta-lactamase superfamily II)